jgi:type I restriction enzyme, R subunit
MRTDTSEGGLEALIVADMTGTRDTAEFSGVRDNSDPLGALRNWIIGDPHDYDRAWTIDLHQFIAFITGTQPALVAALGLDDDGPVRQKFLARLQGEITKRGIIDVLRSGVKHGPHEVTLFFGSPSPGNSAAMARFRHNRFSVTRQLRYSQDDTAHALDLGLFVNGLPVATCELKNSLTKQNTDDAVLQYKRDRDPREKLFEFGRCMVHLAIDDAQVMFCTRLAGKASWFLPFNKGWNDGAGSCSFAVSKSVDAFGMALNTALTAGYESKMPTTVSMPLVQAHISPSPISLVASLLIALDRAAVTKSLFNVIVFFPTLMASVEQMER